MIASRKALIVVAALFALSLGLPWGGTVQTVSAQVSVSAADPNTGEQGTLNLSVLIKGKGFKNGAKAKWFKTGTTDPAGVNVKSTQFVSSTQLIATIDITGAASLSLFDIQVANTDGRTGKGTGLFSVTTKAIDPCTLPDPVPTPSSFISYSPGLPGYLDGTFGGGSGRVIAPRHLELNVDRGAKLAIQMVSGEPRIVMVGTIYNSCQSGATRQWAVVRYLPDGTIDETFGIEGVATKGFGTSGSWTTANAVAVQPDNRIVVVGQSPKSGSAGQPTVVRFNVDGSLDSNFGTGGTVVLTTPGKSPSGSFYTVAVQADGRIVAAGAAAYTPGYIVRLHPNGTVDSSFGAYAGPSAMFMRLRLQRIGSEDRAVLVGATGGTATVWRFTGSGVADTSLGGTGMVVVPFPDRGYLHHNDYLNDVAFDSTGRIVATGYAYYDQGLPVPTTPELALARLNPGGDLDTTFGTSGTGMVVAPSGQAYGIGEAAVIQPDGRIVVVGRSYDYDANGASVNRTAGVWRFTSDGTPDWTFGYAGSGWAPDPVAEGARVVYWLGVALQPDGKIVCGGYVLTSSDPAIYYAALGRFWQ
jgi:uncharacterized delta-60 repeat protein